MNKRTDFIDIISRNRDNPQCYKLIDDLRSYYEINDLDTNNFGGKIFDALYLQNYESYDEIVQDYGIALCTIHRYRLRFNRLALMLAPDELKKRFQSCKN